MILQYNMYPLLRTHFSIPLQYLEPHNYYNTKHLESSTLTPLDLKLTPSSYLKVAPSSYL